MRSDENKALMKRFLEALGEDELFAVATRLKRGVPMASPVFEGATEAQIKAMLGERDRRVGGMTAPAHGLVLWRVSYGKKRPRGTANLNSQHAHRPG